MGDDAELTRLRQERDLYLRLLSLGGHADLEPFLKEALELLVETSGARRGYLEIPDPARGEDAEPWWIAHDCSSEEIASIRSNTSRGIVAEALASGRTIMTPSALLDPRFQGRESVQLGRIQAVLCTPIGGDASLGVVYLEGRPDTGPFEDEDTARVELVARHLAPQVEHLLTRRHAVQEQDPTREWRTRLRLGDVVGRSEALAAVLREAALVAPLDVNVLITGQSGTGKSQLARIIHDNGPRAAGPFVELNCSAIPDALVESELFGQREGAHSTARKAHDGKVGAAQGGTLFLDEIGAVPLASQAKLLQFLQSRQFWPLGATRPVDADVRVIAATNADLERGVQDGSFREDLFYRLQVLGIRMPSLAERREDVAELAASFCRSACERHKLARLELSPGALRAVEAAEWPGNVRQLAHALEAAAIRAAGGGAGRVERTHLFPDPSDASADDPDAADAVTFQEATRRFQLDLLRRTLEATGWNVSETARTLDLARSHVYNLIRAFGLEREDG